MRVVNQEQVGEVRDAPEARTRSARIRAAHLRDVPGLQAFIAGYGSDGTLLPRSQSNLLHFIRDFRVAVDGEGRLVGCGALQLVNDGLAEIRSVAVDPAWRGSGIGSRIVRLLLRDAHRLGIARVFCLTRKVSFFGRLDFVPVPMERFPEKVWNDCRLCPRRDDCDETAMELVFGSYEIAGDRPRPTPVS